MSTQPVLDAGALATWMDEQGLPPGPITELRRLGGGTQNIVVRLSRGGTSYILRRPPLSPRPGSNSALLREVRVLTALQPTAVPTPRIIAVNTDEDVLGEGIVFYLMSDVGGFSPEIELPARYHADPAARRAIGLGAAAAAAKIGQVDVAAVGLTDLGRPAGFLARQVSRWLRELESYQAFPGYPGPDLPHVDVVGDWLERHRPADATPGILHGDFHLANLLYRRDTPQLAAVIDWEMTTVGDPLLDLGWLIATWPDPDWPGVFGESPLVKAGNLAGPDDLVTTYAEHSTRDLGAIEWYVVLACFKLGIVLEGTHARSCAGQATPEIGQRLHAQAIQLLNKARRRIG